MKKLLFITILTTLIFSVNTFSQSKKHKSEKINFGSKGLGYNYKTALGFKFYPGAVTIKHFLKDNAALEGLLYFWDYGTRIAGLYEFHGQIKDAAGLRWYAGPGAHIGFWNNTWRDHYYDYYYTHPYNRTYIGLDGVLGLDYKFKDAPINIGLDWQPSINFGNGPAAYGFYSGFGGIAIRYTF
ncbi:MAG: hypothetical protein NVS1B13_20260 [Flavisolibacter sp.]